MIYEKIEQYHFSSSPLGGRDFAVVQSLRPALLIKQRDFFLQCRAWASTMRLTTAATTTRLVHVPAGFIYDVFLSCLSAVTGNRLRHGKEADGTAGRNIHNVQYRIAKNFTKFAALFASMVVLSRLLFTAVGWTFSSIWGRAVQWQAARPILLLGSMGGEKSWKVRAPRPDS